MHELFQLSALEIARRIAAGEISSLEVVKIHIELIKKVNPVLNAVVQDRFAAALQEAAEADIAIQRGDELGPFHGVPCTIKECFALIGMPNTSGLLARKTYRPPENATAVQRILDSGAIPLGVTNVSELCMWMESDNRVYGRTNNPYDPSRIVGGSSGGEGAIIGSGASPFGLGSDVGGSIRMPAFFNGVFGHKPSSGLIPATGQFPIAKGKGLHYLTTGPLAKKAEDLYPLVKVLAGPDGKDEGCLEIEVQNPSTVELTRIRVLNVKDNGKTKVSPQLRQAQQQVADHLAAVTSGVEVKSFPGLKKSFDIWAAMLGKTQPTSGFRIDMQKPKLRQLLLQLLLWFFGKASHTLPAILLGVFENVGDFLPSHEKKMIQLGEQLREEISNALAEDGVMLFPSFTKTAPKHYVPLLAPFDAQYTAIINVLEYPVTQVPLGLDSQGLPLGIQVVANHGRDHLCMAVALELEKAFGGWVPPAEHAGDSRSKL